MPGVVGDIAGATGIPLAGGVAGYRESIKNFTIGVYATGGVSLSAADLGLGAVTFLAAQSASGYAFAYDYVNSKLLVYRGDNTNAAAAPLIEVANAVDLSAVVTRLLAIGTPA